MLADVRDILVISSPEDLAFFESLLGDGKRFGIKLSYAVQPAPEGLAQAFLIGKDFIGKDEVTMILGDNIFFGNGMKAKLRTAIQNVRRGKATIFGFHVPNPERFGVIEFDGQGKILSLEEKPKQPKSHYAATGLYFYDNRVVEFARRVRPSWRNELEITDVNKMYLEAGDLEAIPLGRGFTWMDAGTPDSLAEASSLIQMIEHHQGLKIACLEEIAFKNRWIGREDLERVIERYPNSDYGKYIARLLKDNILY